MVNMKLVFDGRTVLLGETPESLGMEDGDMVEVGNFACNRATIALCPRGSPLGDPGPLGDLFVDLGPL